MKAINSSKTFSLKRRNFLSISVVLILLTFFSFSIQAQQDKPSQLSLADILIGLRSKKASIEEKNKLLTETAKVRGTTFALTPEIEKELANTGADKNLILTLREKSQTLKTEVAFQPKVVAPVSAPVPSAPKPDFAFYQQNAKDHFAKGEFESAIGDLNGAIELNAQDASVYLNRGLAYYSLKKYQSAILDYDQSILLNPKSATAFFKRGDAYEKIGDNLKAMDSYQKSLDLDAADELAKTSLKRVRAAETAKSLPQPPPPAPTVAETPVIPESVDLGQLNSVALKLVTPVYPDFAKKSSVQGLVTVQVTLDQEGKVVAAKATNGPAVLRSAAEEAARRSKFKPAAVNGQVVKANGFINYSFKL